MHHDEFAPLIFASHQNLQASCDGLPGPSDNAVAWIDGHGAAPRVHALGLGADGLVHAARRIPLGGPTLVVPAGAQIARGAETLTLTGAAIAIGGEEIAARIDISAQDGSLRFAAALPGAAVQAELRYFFAKPAGPSGLAALHYPVFDAQVGAPMQVTGRYDPARPADPRNGLLVTAGQAQRTRFRTTLGRTVTLAPIGGRSGLAHAYDPVEDAYYPVPTGDWTVGLEGGADGPDMNLLLGLSGLEHGRIDAAGALRFVRGGPAFAPGFGMTGPDAARGLTAAAPGALYPVTTPWIYPLDSAAAGPTGGAPRGYYSQPESAALFTPGAGGGFLDLLPLPAGGFPAPADVRHGGATGVMGAPQAAFPAAPYGGVTPGAAPLSTYNAFETDILGPARFAAIGEIDANAHAKAGPLGAAGLSGPTGPTGPVIRAVTPAGLLSEFSSDLTRWDRLLLARSQGPQGTQDLQLTAIDDVLRRALMSNQLFLVVSDKTRLMKHASVQYAVTADVIAALAALAGKPPPASVAQGLAALRRRGVYEDLSLFLPEAQAALKPDFDAPAGDAGLSWGALLLREAARAMLTIGGWRFDVSPDRWVGADGQDTTIMILKFADGALEDLVENPDAWTMADTFNAAPDAVRARLRRIIADAKEAAASAEREFDHFADTVAADPGWNGALFLNVYVPKSAFPPQIEGLAAGIAAPEFRAHHLGVNLSPIEVDNGALQLRDSSLFGLIHYEDPADLVFRGDPYDYKVLSLKILFANSQITSFSSRIELLIAALFGERARLLDGDHGNNIILDGVLQKHGGADSYAFTQTGLSVFEMDSQVLSEIAVTRAQFVTEAPQPGDGGRAATRFLLWGGLRYKALKGFDLFSFGPGEDAGELVFSNMYVAMDFARADPTDRRFEFVAGRMAFDVSASTARPGSLFRRFPLSVVGMVQGAPEAPPGLTGATGPAPHPTTPRELGFIAVKTPLGTGALGPEWFGLEMDLNLGSRGALAGQAPISATLLASWAPDAQQANVALGLRLPGSDGTSLKIAGPLKIDIGSIEMMFAESDEAYLMRLRSIALSFLGVKFPPGGKTNLLLFGDPNPDSNNASLGWYAAYKKDAKKDDGDKKQLGAPDDPADKEDR